MHSSSSKLETLLRQDYHRPGMDNEYTEILSLTHFWKHTARIPKFHEWTDPTLTRGPTQLLDNLMCQEINKVAVAFVEMKESGSLFATRCNLLLKPWYNARMCQKYSIAESGTLKYDPISLPSCWLADWHPLVLFLGRRSTALCMPGPLTPSVYIGLNERLLSGHNLWNGAQTGSEWLGWIAISSTNNPMHFLHRINSL